MVLSCHNLRLLDIITVRRYYDLRSMHQLSSATFLHAALWLVRILDHKGDSFLSRLRLLCILAFHHNQLTAETFNVVRLQRKA